MTTIVGPPGEAFYIDAVKHLRLLPADSKHNFEGGLSLFLGSESSGNTFCLSMSEDEAYLLAKDLNDFFSQQIDVEHPEFNYGRI